MDDEFARALDVLHNRIDGAIETIRPVGTTLKEAPAPVTVIAPILPAEKEKQATSFLVTLFLLGLLLIGLQIVQTRWKKPTPSVKQEVEVPPLLQDDVAQAELEYLLQLKRAPVDENLLRILEDKDPEPEKPVKTEKTDSQAPKNRDEVYSQTTLNRLPVQTQRPNMPKNAFPIESHEIPTLEEDQ